MRKLQTCVIALALFLTPMAPAFAQRHNRASYYNGMRGTVRRGDYERYNRNDRQHHHDDGGIGPGKAALIGGAGGAALGAIFGGSLKGTLIGGAAGAGIGAIVGAAADDNDHHRHHR